MIWMILCYKWKPQFRVQGRQIQKLLKINISFVTSNDFRRLSPFVFVMATSKRKYQLQVSVFSYFCLKFQCLYIFKNLCVDCFRYKLSSVWSDIFLLNGPDMFKKPKQNSSKTKRHSQQQEAKSVRRRTAVSHRNFFWHVVTGTLRWLVSLHCLLYFLAFHWLRPAVLFFLNWKVCLFVKESGYLKLSKLILNWTVRKN